MDRHRNAAIRVARLMACALLLRIMAGPLPSAAAQGAGRTTGQGTGAGRPVAAPAAPDTVDPLARAFDAEDKGQARLAAVSYREVLQRALSQGIPDGDRLALALLGLERTWADLGARDSLLTVVQRVIQVRPTDPIARTMQLRTLLSMAQDDDARKAFEAWRRAEQDQATPYREYARLLLAAGRNAAADSILGAAGRSLGTVGAVSGEVAQLHVAMGRWNSAAVAFREALVQQPYLEAAAHVALSRAPMPTRDSVRTALQAAPITLPARRVLSALELSWGEPRRGWQALAALPFDDSTHAAWRDFGEQVEGAQAWQVARDVWVALLDTREDLAIQARAAQAAVRAGDAAGALTILHRPHDARAAADTMRIRIMVPIEVAALSELGRAREAQQLADAHATRLDAATKASLAPVLVGAWLRSGDIERARATVQASDLADDDETMGWLALYDGDLATARRRLVRAETRRPELVDALGLLARVRLDRSTGLGQAFLLLAKRDSAAATRRVVTLADSIPDAAPALLAIAARLYTARGAWPDATVLWERILRDAPRSPEAPDALLAWARALVVQKDAARAAATYERLLLEYPTSALVPQGRRELERLKGMIP